MVVLFKKLFMQRNLTSPITKDKKDLIQQQQQKAIDTANGVSIYFKNIIAITKIIETRPIVPIGLYYKTLFQKCIIPRLR